MQLGVFLFAIFVVATAASPKSNDYKDNYEYAPAQYEFGYGVKDDYAYVDFGHNENRNGDNTKGQYNVVLPDGRRQVVNYYVDGYSGYVADVKYEGDYKPAYSADYKPAYKPAPKATYSPSYKPTY
ncbi:pro-resilin-like [Daphnia carinata]|uniref:pro-resilin-like n=1 Tax=Daphnia carinata TaxID=120202 RepID=UPI00257A7DB6|nr:pro-resilin-like [Daphnia carinata]